MINVLDRFMITCEGYKTYCDTQESTNLYILHAKNLGVSKVYLRDKNLSSEMLLRFVSSCKLHNMLLFVNYMPKLLSQYSYEIRAIHLKSNEINTANDLRIMFDDHLYISCSAHNLNDILQAHKIGIDFIMISPIFFVEHKALPLGVDFIKQIPNDIKHKIYALGGINQSNISQFDGLGIGGIAGIRMFEKNTNG